MAGKLLSSTRFTPHDAAPPMTPPTIVFPTNAAPATTIGAIFASETETEAEANDSATALAFDDDDDDDDDEKSIVFKFGNMNRIDKKCLFPYCYRYTLN